MPTVSTSRSGAGASAVKPSRRETVAAVVWMAALPAVSAFGLSLIHANISGDVLYETAATVLYWIIQVINELCAYISAAYLAVALLRYGLAGAKTIVWLYVLYAFIPQTGMLLTRFAVSVNPDKLYYISYAAVNVAIELLLGTAIAAAALLTARYPKKRRGSSPPSPVSVVLTRTVLIILAVNILWEAVNTADFFLTYSAPTTRELVSIVSAYLELLLIAIAARAVMWLAVWSTGGTGSTGVRGFFEKKPGKKL